MAPGESSEKNPIGKSLPNIGQETYASIPTEELVVFAVQFLHADGVPATTEEVVSACFKLFPHRFSLKNYFYWPDSAQVMSHLNRAKEKGYIKETPADGFKVKVVGRPVAKQVAKTLGIPMPMPPKVEKPKPAEAEPAKPQVKEPSLSAEEKSIAVVEKKKPAKKKKAAVKKKVAKPAKKSVHRMAKPVKKTVTPKKVLAKKAKPKKTVVTRPAPAKTKTAPKLKPKVKAKKVVPPAAPKKIKPVQKQKKQVKQKAKKAQTAHQLPLLMPARPKPAKKAPAAKPAKQKIAKAEKNRAAEKIHTPVLPSISKEEKIKAGKAVHTLERSDAYRQYQKFGGKARISEFDFRNMLFATMESSAETLKRNVDLFRRYAGIHNRADLITFLDFAEGSFAPLLKTQARHPLKKR